MNAPGVVVGNLNRDLAIFKYYENQSSLMVQKQVAFEKTTQRQEALTLSAKRLGEHQELPVPMSITWLRWWFEITSASKCVVGEAHSLTSSYTTRCRECGKIGDKFTLYFTLNLYSKLEKNKQSFVNHWNKEHVRLQGPKTSLEQSDQVD